MAAEMRLAFCGRMAVVTGGASGIGRASREALFLRQPRQTAPVAALGERMRNPLQLLAAGWP